MKSALPLLALAAAVATAGCNHLELVGLGNPDRVLTGTVVFSESAQSGDAANPPPTLPPDAVLVVQVIDPNPPNVGPPMPTTSVAATHVAAPPEVLGEQTIKDLGAPPFAYRITYTAEDDELRHGLIVEARISSGGQLLYSNTETYGVGLADVGDSHRVVVNSVAP